jgi:uncharacterized protein
MQKMLIVLTVVLGATTVAAASARADFAAGAQAYDGGDYETAFAEWNALANSGDAEAQVAIAGLYRFGAGRSPDIAKAAFWYRRAARQGDEIAQLNLGELYIVGDGVKRDLVKAYKWLSLAAARGNAWAVGKRDEISGRLTRAQLSRARSWIHAWRPGRPDQPAPPGRPTP